MQLVKGDLWEAEWMKADLILFTANSQVDSLNRLVMGAGSAKEAKERDFTLPGIIGEWLVRNGLVGEDFLLWLPDDIPLGRPRHTIIGALQTKRKWKDPSPLYLVARSIQHLNAFLPTRRVPWRVAMPLPGCGLGGLKREDVLPLLEILPDTVTVYER